ncbi:MAG: cache domain-containing protein, partial [Methanosarcinales archaeon]|nr:cache domain-containing protein [Methanosarcinales archaeon]
MEKLKDIKIKTKLMAICLILVTIPVLVLGLASYNATKSGINEQSSVLLQQEVLLAKAQVESNYDMIQQKLRSDLQVARSHYQEHLGYADRRTSRVAVHPDVISSFSDPGSMHNVLAGIAQKEGFDILTVTDTRGKVIARASSTKTGDTFVPGLVRKGVGSGFAATEIIGSQYIANEGLSGQVGAGNDGMVLTSVYPIVVDGKTAGTVVGGYVLNYNYEIVDAVQSIVGGTATIFQDHLRISTNVLKTDGNRAVGTTISDTVYDTVVKGGKTYYGTAWVVN